MYEYIILTCGIRVFNSNNQNNYYNCEHFNTFSKVHVHCPLVFCQSYIVILLQSNCNLRPNYKNVKKKKVITCKVISK